MGVNNKQRRAAKQRKRGRQRATGTQQTGTTHGASATDAGWDANAAHAFAELSVITAVRRISRMSPTHAELCARAETLVRRLESTPRSIIESVVSDLLSRLVDAVVRGGWGPADLAELVRRSADARHVPTLAAVLHADARRHKRYGGEWLAALDAVGPEERLQIGTTDGLASGLQVSALLGTVPLLAADSVLAGAEPTVGRAEEHPKLARVRALLAKAESTDFDDEAEALSAKAQELISRYALERLLSQSHGRSRGDEPAVRRIWLDAPYVRAKAALVHEVASANRCQAAVAEKFGFCLVVGARTDLAAVELLVTSLLVQANTAMLRHGRRVTHSGASRTRSFRQSFLMAYATRIGERLRSATNDATSAEGARELLPVLRDHEARVTAAFEAMVPHTVAKTSSISNGEGWEAGLVAADLALLDVNGKLPERQG